MIIIKNIKHTLPRSLSVLLAGLLFCSGSRSFGQSQPAGAAKLLPQFQLQHVPAGFPVELKADHGDGIYREGDKLIAELKLGREAHVYLVYHQSDGKSLLFFPNSEHPESSLAAGKPIALPGEDDHFHFTIRPPFGTDVLQLIASVAPIDEFDALSKQESQPPLISDQLWPALRERLAKTPDAWSERRLKVRTFPRDGSADRRVGLFVGVGSYQHADQCPPRAEFSRSASALYEAMVANGALDPERTQLVLDEQATRKTIAALLTEWLPQASRPGDTVVLYFSGYDLPGIAANSVRSASSPLNLAMYDAHLLPTSERISYDDWLASYRSTVLSEEALQGWLDKLSDRRIVLITDTCRPQPGSKTTPDASSAKAGSAAKNSAAGFTTLRATSDASPQLFDGMRQGRLWFTSALIDVFEQAGPRPLAAAGAFEQAGRRLAELVPAEHPARQFPPMLSGPKEPPIVLIP